MKHGASQAALSRLGVKQHRHSVDEKFDDLDLLETESLAGFMLILESGTSYCYLEEFLHYIFIAKPRKFYLTNVKIVISFNIQNIQIYWTFVSLVSTITQGVSKIAN